MATRFAKLFRLSEKPSDGLTQPQREAIVDLLHYCMYADNHLALSEDRIFEDTVSHLNWDPGTSYESYEARSIAWAREAKEHPESREEFLKSVQERISSRSARALALKVCHQIFLADGQRSDQEASLEARLQQLLG